MAAEGGGTLFLDGVAFDTGDESWTSVDNVRIPPPLPWTKSGYRQWRSRILRVTHKHTHTHTHTHTQPSEDYTHTHTHTHTQAQPPSFGYTIDEIMALHGPAQALMLDEGTVFDEAVCGWHDIHDPGRNLGTAFGPPGTLRFARTDGGYTSSNTTCYSTNLLDDDAEASENGSLTSGNRAEAGAGGDLGNHGATACTLSMVRTFQSSRDPSFANPRPRLVKQVVGHPTSGTAWHALHHLECFACKLRVEIKEFAMHRSRESNFQFPHCSF